MKLSDRIINKIWRSVSLPKARLKIGLRDFKVPRFTYNHFYKSNYQTEDWLIQLLKKFKTEQHLNSVLDVGANIGQTLLKVKSINSEVKYVGFEPNPYCCVIIQQIISQNKLKNAFIIPCGLSDRSQILKLNHQENNILDSSASLISGFRKSTSDNVQIVTVSILDEIWEKLPFNTIDLIKIDIEGAELEAFRGMQKTIRKYKPIIILEVLPSHNDTNDLRINRQKELAKLIQNNNYKIYHLKNKDVNIEFESVATFQIHNNIDESDYILLPFDMNINNIIGNF